MLTGNMCGAAVWRCLGCGRSVAKNRARDGGGGCPKCPPGTAVHHCTRTDPTPGHPGGCEIQLKDGGATRCYRHGGTTRQAQISVRKRQAAVVVQRLAVPIVGTDHIAALQDALDLSHGIVDTLVRLVNTLDLEVTGQVWNADREAYEPAETAGIAGATYHQSGIATGEAKPHIFVTLLAEERDRYSRLSIECAKLGIAERHAQVEEAKIAVLADVLRAVFDDPELGMTGEQRQTATQVTARHLRLLDAGIA